MYFWMKAIIAGVLYVLSLLAEAIVAFVLRTRNLLF